MEFPAAGRQVKARCYLYPDTPPLLSITVWHIIVLNKHQQEHGIKEKESMMTSQCCWWFSFVSGLNNFPCEVFSPIIMLVSSIWAGNSVVCSAWVTLTLWTVIMAGGVSRAESGQWKYLQHWGSMWAPASALSKGNWLHSHTHLAAPEIL